MVVQFGQIQYCCICLFVQSFDHTHKPIPAQTNVMPTHVSRVITLPSAHHSPRTVNRKASEFVIGTVRDNSDT